MRALLATLALAPACGGGVPDDIVGRIVVHNDITASFQPRTIPDVVTSPDTGTLTISPAVSAVLAAHMPAWDIHGVLARSHRATLVEPGRELTLIVAAGRDVSFAPPLAP